MNYDCTFTYSGSNQYSFDFQTLDVEFSSVSGTYGEIIGTWNNGIWFRDIYADSWVQTYQYVPDYEIAAGDVDGDGKDEMISCWKSGLWYQDADGLGWTRVHGIAPSKVASGDLNGDGWDEIIGTWNGIWYRDLHAGAWTQTYKYVPDYGIAAGDMDGNGKDEMISCWTSGLWYQDAASLDWTRVYGIAPSKVASGNVRVGILPKAAGSDMDELKLGIPGQEGPGGALSKLEMEEEIAPQAPVIGAPGASVSGMDELKLGIPGQEGPGGSLSDLEMQEVAPLAPVSKDAP